MDDLCFKKEFNIEAVPEEWRDKLSNNEWERFFRNIRKYNNKDPEAHIKWAVDNNRNFGSFIGGGFSWSSSPEGYRYWSKISKR